MGTLTVKVLGEAMIARFAQKHTASRKPLQRFLEIARAADWPHFPALKRSFAAADYTSRGMVIFDIGGNKYRLVVTVSFEKQILLIERVLTHEEYDREDF
ncbi:MAG: type II toxin-antitoxin system HigB family toxin [Bryobacteraceae bacterium]|jgi:mRNA interferase HigB